MRQNIELQNQTQATLSTVTGKLKSEIIDYEIQAGAAAARARDTAAEEKAITAASAVGGQERREPGDRGGTTATLAKRSAIAEVGSTAQGLAAVKAAESQIGVPYVWGGETPAGAALTAPVSCSGPGPRQASPSLAPPRRSGPTWCTCSLHGPPAGDLLCLFQPRRRQRGRPRGDVRRLGPWGIDTTIAAPTPARTSRLAPLFTSGLIGAAQP